MPLTNEQTRPIRVFEIANLISAAALLAGAFALGHGDLLPGGVIGAAAAAISKTSYRAADSQPIVGDTV